MSKRQRFFVELREDEVTVISWKKLVADAERILDVTRAAAAAAAPPRVPPAPTLRTCASPNANTPENLNTAQNPLKPRRKLKLDAAPRKATFNSTPTVEAAERKRRGSPLGDRNLNEPKHSEKGLQQKQASVKMIKAVKAELGDVAKQAVPKGKVHRSMPVPCPKTSCRTKKAKACFCCSKKGNIRT